MHKFEASSEPTNSQWTNTLLASYSRWWSALTDPHHHTRRRPLGTGLHAAQWCHRVNIWFDYITFVWESRRPTASRCLYIEANVCIQQKRDSGTRPDCVCVCTCMCPQVGVDDLSLLPVLVASTNACLEEDEDQKSKIHVHEPCSLDFAFWTCFCWCGEECRVSAAAVKAKVVHVAFILRLSPDVVVVVVVMDLYRGVGWVHHQIGPPPK